jgi:Uma2 family endonuclease
MANPETLVDEPEPSYCTAETVRALNDAEEGSTRYECVYGELVVSPGPAELHQAVVSRVFAALIAYVDRWKLPYFVMTSPSDISWGRSDVLVQPDVFVVTRDAARRLVAGARWDIVRELPLAIEVISPSSRRYDRFKKRVLYQRQDVPLCWVVDPEQQSAEEWTPTLEFPRIQRERSRSCSPSREVAGMLPRRRRLPERVNAFRPRGSIRPVARRRGATGLDVAHASVTAQHPRRIRARRAPRRHHARRERRADEQRGHADVGHRVEPPDAEQQSAERARRDERQPDAERRAA